MATSLRTARRLERRKPIASRCATASPASMDRQCYGSEPSWAGWDHARAGFFAAVRASSVQMEFVELAMVGLDVTHRAGDRAHHHRFGLDHVLAEFDT